MVKTVNDDRKEFLKHLTNVIKEFLMKRGQSLWPIKSGYSIDNFEISQEEDGIDVGHKVRYPIFVNNATRTRGGNPNKNYEAGQRTLDKFWNSITAEANKRIK